jgi:beta-glucanase (GH16 family)
VSRSSSERTRRRLRRVCLAAALLPAIVGACAVPSGSAPPSGPNPPGSAEPGGPASAPDARWRLIWSDEFDGDEVDPAHWTVRNLSTFGDGNRAIACLMDRPENVRVEGGHLILTARSEQEAVRCGQTDPRFPDGRRYTSGFLESRGKAEFEYGRFEVRARLPLAHGTSKGLWPAFWMRPSDLSLGELDVMEAIGSGAAEPDGSNRVFHSIHYDYDDTHPMQSRLHVSERRFSDGFHTFAVEWEPGSLRWFVDDELTYERTTGTTPWLDEAFSGPFFLRLNLAVGGTWPGEPDADTAFPASYVIDHVRVYQR